MKKIIPIGFLFCVLAAVDPDPLHAQNSVQAVMEISVEVIPGSRVVSHTSGNFLLSMAEKENPDNYEVDLGTHTLSVQDSVEILVSCDKFVRASSGSDDMYIEMEINQQKSLNGDVTFLLSGTIDARGGVDYGLYIGSQLTRIEYN